MNATTVVSQYKGDATTTVSQYKGELNHKSHRTRGTLPQQSHGTRGRYHDSLGVQGGGGRYHNSLSKKCYCHDSLRIQGSCCHDSLSQYQGDATPTVSQYKGTECIRGADVSNTCACSKAVAWLEWGSNLTCGYSFICFPLSSCAIAFRSFPPGIIWQWRMPLCTNPDTFQRLTTM